ncbi:MAG: cation transporter [Myxococcales bacterium]|nr:cation transporter [Myxococcales bacterium]
MLRAGSTGKRSAPPIEGRPSKTCSRNWVVCARRGGVTAPPRTKGERLTARPRTDSVRLRDGSPPPRDWRAHARTRTGSRLAGRDRAERGFLGGRGGRWLLDQRARAPRGCRPHGVGRGLALGRADRHSHPNAGPSPEYTFGLRRAPVLGALVNAMLLVAIVGFIAFEAVQRMGSPPAVHGWAAFVVGVLGLVVNLVSAWYLTRTHDHSVNMRGAVLHLMADALGSIAVAVSALLVALLGLRLADPIASLVIATLIAAGTWPLLRDTLRILLQRAPLGLRIEEVRRLLLDHPEVDEVHDLHVWEVDSGAIILTGLVACRLDRLEDANRLADQTRRLLEERFGIDHATLEFRHRRAGDCRPAY